MDFNKETIINMIKAGNNPQQLVASYLGQTMGNNNFVNNLLSLANKKDDKTLETIARNVCKEKGLDYDTEINAFKQKIGAN